jgi:hypothetical protein
VKKAAAVQAKEVEEEVKDSERGRKMPSGSQFKGSPVPLQQLEEDDEATVISSGKVNGASAGKKHRKRKGKGGQH